MDHHQPLLPRIKLHQNQNTPRTIRKLGSGYLTPRNITTNLKPHHDKSSPTLLPNFATTPKVKSIADLVINFNRSTSAPALYTDEKGNVDENLVESLKVGKKRRRLNSSKITCLALLGLVLYVIIGVTVLTLSSEKFGDHQTIKVIDALYFTVVTLSTIGYGDIVPSTTFAKLFTCVFILVGFGFIDVLLNGLLTYVLDMQEEVLLGAVDQNSFKKMVKTYIYDDKKCRMRIRMKMGLALGVVVICLAVGTVTVHCVEELAWVDSFYLSVTSVTTVGYGDFSFKTATGKTFAIVWLLASTLAVARAFLYLVEYRIEKRNRRTANEVLHKKLTLGDLVAADLDRDGCISKAEYVVFKLKEMGRITEQDIEQICEQFDTIEDYNHSTKITVTDLIMKAGANPHTNYRQTG